ncbi:MarR family winged helix-turn-helix transcriptional regulator [Bacillus kexueae]|uniref:MarR family winged helix-turn-helix transcriptional regulator n=1 Tax=Aeribacillus kexueae TaxID=2078952 RepID=UPI001FAE8F02
MSCTGKNDHSLKLYVVLSKAYRAIHDYVSKHIQSYGLNPTEFAVLELLYHKGHQPLQQIGGKILLASGSITYVVDKLEKKELIERKACPNDRRVTHAVLTEKGTQLMEDMFPKHKEFIDETLSVLSDEEKIQATDILRKLGLHVKELD